MSVFMQPIYTQTVGAGGVASVTFNNIPQGYTDLKILVSVRATTTAAYYDNAITINGDTASGSYSFTELTGPGNASPYSGRGTTATSLNTPYEGSDSTSNTFTNTEIYIPNYNSGNQKQIIVDAVTETNAASTQMRLQAWLWHKTNPVTSITFTANPSLLFAQYSTFTLYGVAEQYSTQTPVAPTIGSVTDQAGFASVAFTPTTPDQAVTYAVTDSSSNTTYGSSSPIVAPVTLGSSTTFTAKAINNLGTASSATSGAITSANSYSSISTFVNTNNFGVGYIYFTNIPQNYTHLQLRAFVRCATSSNQLPVFIQFNGDGSSNYTEHSLQGDGSSATSGSQGASTSIGWYSFAGASTTSGVFGVGVLDILDYTNTSKYKTVRGLSGFDNNGSGDVNLTSGAWLNNFSPITSITLSPYGGALQYSHFALYGIA